MKLFAGDKKELIRSREIKSTSPAPEAETIRMMARNCGDFQQEYGFIMSSLTEEEENFPIAFSILVFIDAYQVRLFSVNLCAVLIL